MREPYRDRLETLRAREDRARAELAVVRSEIDQLTAPPRPTWASWIGLIATVAAWVGSGCVLVLAPPPPGRLHEARRTAETIRSRVFLRADLSGRQPFCPKPQDLAAGGWLAADRLHDPWGHVLRIHCGDDGDIRVVSDGPDGVPGTADDVAHDGPRR